MAVNKWCNDGSFENIVWLHKELVILLGLWVSRIENTNEGKIIVKVQNKVNGNI